MTTGKSKADFPGAFIPFDKSPGPVPGVPIDSAPTVQLCINESWLPYVVTCLKALSRPETWDDTYDNSVIAASEFAALLGNISDGCGVVVPSIMCISGSFADLDYGFEPTPGAACTPTWVPGVGWEMCADSTPQGHLQIRRVFSSETFIRGVSLTILVTPPYLVNYDVTLWDGSSFVSVASETGNAGPVINIDVSGLSQPAFEMYIEILETFGGAAADAVITDWKICYTGAFPLSLPSGEIVRVFDFTVSDEGFTVWTERPYGHWAAGGWTQQNNQVGNSSIYIAREFDFGGIVTRIIATGSSNFGDHNQLGLNHEDNDDLEYTPGAGTFVVNTGPISWNVTSGERLKTVLVNITHHPTALTYLRLEVHSASPVFS